MVERGKRIDCRAKNAGKEIKQESGNDVEGTSSPSSPALENGIKPI